MDEIISGYAQEASSPKALAGMLGQYRKPTAMERLRSQREVLASKLAETDAAIAALEAHPEVEAVLATLSRAL